MQVTRTSMISGKTHTLDLPVTVEQIQELQSPGRRMIQDIFPDLTPDQREFLMTGITKEEWDEAFGEGE